MCARLAGREEGRTEKEGKEGRTEKEGKERSWIVGECQSISHEPTRRAEEASNIERSREEEREVTESKNNHKAASHPYHNQNKLENTHLIFPHPYTVHTKLRGTIEDDRGTSMRWVVVVEAVL